MDSEAQVADAPQEAADLRAIVRNAMAEEGLTQATIARESGLSQTTLSQWLKGQYPGDNEAIAAKIATWLSSRTVAKANAAPTVTGWIDTPTGRKIEAALTAAQHEQTIAVVYGGAGVGKTSAIRRYSENRPNVWRVTAAPSTAGLMAALEAIGAALDLRDLPNRPANYSREIVRRMVGTKGLLVIDEAQHLSVQALEEVRSIHDQAATGIAFVGNEAVYARLTGGSRKATFAQLFSRIGHRLSLTGASRADTDAMLAAWGIVGAAERDWAHKVASLPGGLRGLVQTLRSASIVATKRAAAVDVRLLQAAWLQLGGES